MRFFFKCRNFKGKEIQHLTSLSLSGRMWSVKDPSVSWQTLFSVFWKGLNGYILVSTDLGKYKKTSISEFFQLEQPFEEAACPILKRHFKSILVEPGIRVHLDPESKRLDEKLFFF